MNTNMEEQAVLNYERVASAITYIRQNFKMQPGLDEIAAHVNLSPFHFQKLFSEWAGTTPKKFLQYVSIGYAKGLLKEQQATLFDTTAATGLSGTGRLHDLFVNIEGMTPAEYKHGGKDLTIAFAYSATPFGQVITASTAKGLCYMAFEEDRMLGLAKLKKSFPSARYREERDIHQQNALRLFEAGKTLPQIKLHLKGTEFQLKVWDALLKIPVGQLTTYGRLAQTIASPKASRAVGTAIGSNPIAYLIPCHRVIQTGGLLGGYMWGTTRKSLIIGWEAAQLEEKSLY
jgi:AraC family transcriptional regulator of adaptative response/methylated-DNA-[protein]-cysteine methyltransferase